MKIVAPICPYCGNKAKLVNGTVIYPHRQDLFHKNFWLCHPCGAYVGTHKNSRTFTALGRLANAELRKAKIEAHAAFDPLWQSGDMERREAYAMLSEKLGISRNSCHIGMFDVDMCQRVVEVMNTEG